MKDSGAAEPGLPGAEATKANAAPAKLTLTIVIGSLDRGGSERQMVELVRSSHPDHALCTVICLGHDGELADAVREVGVEVLAVGLDRPWKLRRLWALARALRRTRPDVVYALLFWGYCLALPTARVAIPQTLRVAGRRSLPADDRPRRAVWLPLRRLADRCSHVVIANSQQGAAAWVREAPWLEGRVTVVVNGVQMPLEPASPRPHPAPMEIVCVANYIHYKGLDVLIEALARLSADLPSWRASLVGEGPEREALAGLIDRLSLTNRVRLEGRRSDVGAVLHDATLLVLPSRGEGMPNAVLEAMSHGVPVVASAVGGVPELLASGAGLMVTPEDPVALAAAITKMLSDDRARAVAGAEGRRKASELYSVPEMRDATLDVMRGCIAARTRRA